MIKTEKLTKLFATEEVQTKALNEVTLQVEHGQPCFYSREVQRIQIPVGRQP